MYRSGMETPILVGTADGLWHVGAASASVDALVGHAITALARDGERTWAIVDDRALWAGDEDGRWQPVATLDGPAATCLAPTAASVLVGTEEAHLLRLAEGRPARVTSFERAPGRESWYTPWGDPADVRSITAGRAPAASEGAIYVNVHVGGVVRSRDGGRSWTPTLDIETDVHQVLAHPTRPGVVLVAAAVGLGVSRDDGDSWEFVTAGLHAHYLRAVAVAGDTVLVTASTGPRGKRAAIYRKPLEGGGALERCQTGLPRWFDGNIDTACLTATDRVAVAGTEDGRVYRSLDEGVSWELVAKGLPAIRCVAV